MKLSLILSLIQLILGCSNPDKSNNVDDVIKTDSTAVILQEDTLNVPDSLIRGLSDEVVTITFSYAAIECGCPQWFQIKNTNEKRLDVVERFYLEPIGKGLKNANDLWDGEHLPLIIKVTGRFSKEKELPITYHTKSEPEKARIFWYNKLVVVSPSSK